MIRIIIADDHEIYRDGVDVNLSNQLGMELVGQAATYQEVFDLLATTAVDVAVLDLNGMGDSPPRVIPELLTRYPRLAIIILSSEYRLARQYLKRGVLGYVAKDDAKQQLIKAIQSVVKRRPYISPRVLAEMDTLGIKNRETGFTPTEEQVAHLVASGMSTADIADYLNIAKKTISNHLTSIYAKAGCTSRAEFIVWYRDHYGDHNPPE